MGKKSTGGGKGGTPAKPLDRAARLVHGRAILRKVQDRIDTLEMKSMSGLPNQGKKANPKTRKKYEAEEILEYAYPNSVSEAELRVCVDLARLAEEIEKLREADLTEALETGRLMLLKSELPDLLKSDDIEGQLRSRLKEQI